MRLTSKCCFFVIFCLTVNSSCGIKSGLYNLNNYDQPLGINEEPLQYWEFEVFTPRLIENHADIVLGIGYNSGKEEGTIEVDEYGRWPEVESNMWDFHLGARFFPLGIRDRIMIPYVGSGVGNFEYDIVTNTPDGDINIDDEWFYGRYKIEKHQYTLAHGYFT